VLGALRPRDGGAYLDLTVGLGGHAAAILEASRPGGRLFGLDRDGEQLALAAARLAAFGDRATLAHGDYRGLRALAAGWGAVAWDGILLDLGVSSFQFAAAERGFSFARPGPLDMRMDRRGTRGTAADLLATAPERELVRILREYGEERWATRIARAIVAARRRGRLETTAALAELVARAIPRRAWPPRTHPATRTFQALRIAVNEELEGLAGALADAADLLAAGGRLAVIAFHSLEDRAVKQTFRRLGQGGGFVVVTKRPVRPTEGEVARNPRARSARLRVLARAGREEEAWHA
jgi:16S rRNA (cytosine1402-N4)-methyltransferase